MLRNVSELEGYTIGAIDDTVGEVSDLYFDDRAWSGGSGIRFSWLPSGSTR